MHGKIFTPAVLRLATPNYDLFKSIISIASDVNESLDFSDVLHRPIRLKQFKLLQINPTLLQVNRYTHNRVRKKAWSLFNVQQPA